MLDLQQLTIAYGQARAVWDISLKVGAGELLCVVGPNGAGKTTLVNTVAGILKPMAGRIVMEGKDITSLAPHKFCEAGIALVPEGRRLFTGMTVAENLDIGSYLPAAKARRRETLDEVLALFPALKAKLPSPAGELSGGQQQMVAIGRALMARPRLLLLDEPSLGLSPLVVADMFNAIKKISASGITIVLVEQNVSMAMRISHRACVLELGRIVAEGAPDELMKQPEIRKAYLGT
ncbi:ABC transporter ATP-binding protein [Ramlibacter sp. WS9]|uniref:ABC transporter ATP-binding protein n=1 Tax=Ramlibacter sp. WS9 TaxID=1882741 RepID=UPI0011423E6E|nr:ABC transporter ATP-binding protein [Ramlibacter sp. WS9]ROZ79854.1 ABC transporter ATP-binding protein [Ramlibacter sp. WS9]